MLVDRAAILVGIRQGIFIDQAILDVTPRTA
jgi:hypothetical protein